ncbi:MAG: hypothetical protein DMG05_06760 [Acidobacteria bacterium]|nr:MAG: hypothetical protein DMG05_06760 [Acidobacteriota bacterium]
MTQLPSQSYQQQQKLAKFPFNLLSTHCFKIFIQKGHKSRNTEMLPYPRKWPEDETMSKRTQAIAGGRKCSEYRSGILGKTGVFWGKAKECLETAKPAWVAGFTVFSMS